MRPIAVRVMGRRWPVTVHGAEHVPASGGVILAANHIGLLDGPLLATYAPRPVHALTKREMFDGRLGGFLRGTGQIPLDRFATDPARDPDRPAGGARRGSARHLPRGHPRRRRLPPLPPRRGLPRAGDRCARRPRDADRHARSRQRALDPGVRATRSTSSSGDRGGRHSSRGPAPGNTWPPPRCCCGDTCCPSWTAPSRRRADPCPGPFLRDNPRTTPTPGSSSRK